MRGAVIFGVLAMIPAALNASAPVSITLPAPSCAGGQRAVTVPMRPVAPAREDGQPCCMKGCHSGTSRKRFLAHC